MKIIKYGGPSPKDLESAYYFETWSSYASKINFFPEYMQ